MIYIAAVLIPTTAKLQLSPCTLQCEIRTITIHSHVLVSDTPIVALIAWTHLETVPVWYSVSTG